MIIEIIPNNIEDVYKIWQYLLDICSFQLSNNVFYIYTNDISIISQKIKKIKYSIKEITSDNYMSIESDIVRNWAYNKILEEELNEFEKSEACQKRLREISDFIDAAEEYLKTGGDVNGGAIQETNQIERRNNENE